MVQVDAGDLRTSLGGRTRVDMEEGIEQKKGVEVSIYDFEVVDG